MDVIAGSEQWNKEALGELLQNPMKFISETRMAFSPGGAVPIVSSDQRRTDLIAYLKKATIQ